MVKVFACMNKGFGSVWRVSLWLFMDFCGCVDIVRFYFSLYFTALYFGAWGVCGRDGCLLSNALQDSAGFVLAHLRTLRGLHFVVVRIGTLGN